MATEAQVTANRLNAQKSTGPRTEEGKAKVAQNAVTHGLRAQTAVLAGEDREKYDAFCTRLLEEWEPDGPDEEVLARRVVDLTWRLQRAGRSQNEVFAALYAQYVAEKQSQASEESPTSDPGPGTAGEGASWLGQMLVKDFSGDRILERLLSYERRIESSLYRAMGELRQTQQFRLLTQRAMTTARENAEGVGGSGPAPHSAASNAKAPSCQTKPISAKGARKGLPVLETGRIPAGGPRLEDYIADKQSQFVPRLAAETLNCLHPATRYGR